VASFGLYDQIRMENINGTIGKVDWKSDDQTIEFYEKNKLYFDNFELITEREKIVQFIRIKLRYAESIYKKFRYDQVLAVTTQIEKLIEKLNQDDPEFLKADQYRRFLSGMTLGRKKLFRQSNKIFKTLVAEDPHNHMYSVWNSYTKLSLYNWVLNGVAIAGGVLVLIDLLFSLKEKNNIAFGTIGLTMSIAAFLTQEALKQYFKKKT
jgi:hypothetical protein